MGFIHDLNVNKVSRIEVSCRYVLVNSVIFPFFHSFVQTSLSFKHFYSFVKTHSEIITYFCQFCA